MSGHIKFNLDFIPVEERLPATGERVYALKEGGRFLSHDRLFAGRRINDGTCTVYDCWGEIEERASVTHWAKIPEAKEGVMQHIEAEIARLEQRQRAIELEIAEHAGFIRGMAEARRIMAR